MKFVDFFAGIGGIRLGFEQAGYKCVYSCEKDPFAIKTYEANFNKVDFNDIKDMDYDEIMNIPEFDVFVGGFPCQPFSVCGKQNGFKDVTRGTLFFDILRILEIRKPKVVFLENVSHLINHDNKNTFKVIKESLKELGYHVFYQVLNSSSFGLPQNRQRIYIVCFLDDIKFEFPKPHDTTPRIKDILEETENHIYLPSEEYTLLQNQNLSPNGMLFVGYLNKKIRNKGIKENTLNLSRVHKQPNRIYSSDYIHPCLCAGETSGRYHILTEKGVRKLTLTECFRLQGFPDDFKKPVAMTQLYKQIGNSVSVPVIKKIAESIKEQVELIRI